MFKVLSYQSICLKIRNTKTLPIDDKKRTRGCLLFTEMLSSVFACASVLLTCSLLKEMVLSVFTVCIG